MFNYKRLNIDSILPYHITFILSNDSKYCPVCKKSRNSFRIHPYDSQSCSVCKNKTSVFHLSCNHNLCNYCIRGNINIKDRK